MQIISELNEPVHDAVQLDLRAVPEAVAISFSVSQHYQNLMDADDAECPLRRQVMPDLREFQEAGSDDVLEEQAHEVSPRLVHRYPSKVLFLVSDICATYCRHCTRKYRVFRGNGFISEQDVKSALDYISNHTEIRDVLFSGGDPLMMDLERLVSIMHQVKAIAHVRVVRIGTRVPVMMPDRITDAFVQDLTAFKPSLRIHTQFNHIKELSPEALAACRKFIDNGILVGNQTVLLRDINDTLDAQMNLNDALIENGIIPYYLYYCDNNAGLQHFRTTYQAGIDILSGWLGKTAGYAVPHLVLDSAEGKIRILPETQTRKDKHGNIWVKAHNGREVCYINPKV